MWRPRAAVLLFLAACCAPPGAFGGGGGGPVAPCDDTTVVPSYFIQRNKHGETCNFTLTWHALPNATSTNATGGRRLGAAAPEKTGPLMNANETFVTVTVGPLKETGGIHFIQQIGLLMALNAGCCILLFFMGQSTIVAFILVGVISGLAIGDAAKSPEAKSVLGNFSTMGILMLLFMAGLEVDIAAFIKRARIVGIMACGQIALNTGLGIAVAVMLDLVKGADKPEHESVAMVYFGLCLTFSSTIVVLGMLKNTRQLETMQGQVCLGTLVLQDVTAVVGLAVLESLAPDVPTDQSLGVALVVLIGKMIGCGIIMFLLAKYVLEHVFLHLASSGELLFVGIMGFAMASAGIADAISFSPEIAAFMAGVALTILPYKMEIEDKVDPIKTLGVTIFFITLGLDIPIDESAVEAMPKAVIVAMIILLVTMPMMLLLGTLADIKSKPAFMIGGIVNQISEFSLILASVCVRKSVFPKAALTVLTFACVLTIIVSSIGHNLLEKGYAMAAPKLTCMDARNKKRADKEAAALAASGKKKKHEHSHHPKEGCVVILGCTEMTAPFVIFAHRHGLQSVIVDYNPLMIQRLAKHGHAAEHGHEDIGLSDGKGGHGDADAEGDGDKKKGKSRLKAVKSEVELNMEKGWHEKFELVAIYADICDPDTWDEAGLKNASIIVNTVRKSFDANMSILHWLQRNESTALFMPCCDTNAECLEIYDAASTEGHHSINCWAIHQDQLAASKLEKELATTQPDGFAGLGESRHTYLKKLKQTDAAQFAEKTSLVQKFLGGCGAKSGSIAPASPIALKSVKKDDAQGGSARASKK